MYTILVNDDNTLVTSVRERIMQRSKLMNSLHFLVKPKYEIETVEYDNTSTDTSDTTEDTITEDTTTDTTTEDTTASDTITLEEKSDGEVNVEPIVVDGIADMSKFTVMLEYLTPVSKQYKSEILALTVDDEGKPKTYKDRLEYKLPFDTYLTSEAGDIEVQLTFTAVDLDADGNGYQYVRKTSTTAITITPISAWSDIVTDKALNAIDQRLLETQKQIKALEELNDISAVSKADNITLDSGTNTIALTANGEKIGDAISISELGNSIADNTDAGLIKMVVI